MAVNQNYHRVRKEILTRQMPKYLLQILAQFEQRNLFVTERDCWIALCELLAIQYQDCEYDFQQVIKDNHQFRHKLTKLEKGLKDWKQSLL
jgi:hypothetical protein